MHHRIGVRLTLMTTTLIGLACAGSDPKGGAPLTFGFDKYHTVEEFNTYVHDMTSRHDDLATLVEIGRSREHHPILAVEINNPATGAAEDKPAYLIHGNILEHLRGVREWPGHSELPDACRTPEPEVVLQRCGTE